MTIDKRLPEVSVVVPAFNEGGIIRSSLAAITSQLEATEPSYEIIVVDAESTDSTSAPLGLATDENAKVRTSA